MSRTSGFTLLELLVVMFIIAVMASIIVPTISELQADAPVVQSERYITAISSGITSYRATFQSYPPSEPEQVDRRHPFVHNSAAGFYGASALRIYMIGHKEGDSYRLVSDRGSWGGWKYEKNRGWGPFVKGVPLNNSRLRRVNNSGYAGGDLGVFVDAWGRSFEYFLANRRFNSHGGGTAADIYPRATDSPLPPSEPGYEAASAYRFRGEPGNKTGDGIVVAGTGVVIPVMRWLSGAEDYGTGNDWATRAAPTNATTFIVVSRGEDGHWGSPDDVANW